MALNGSVDPDGIKSAVPLTAELCAATSAFSVFSSVHEWSTDPCVSSVSGLQLTNSRPRVYRLKLLGKDMMRKLMLRYFCYRCGMSTKRKYTSNVIQACPADERRASERFETDEAATILLPNSSTAVVCRVLNRSEGGALLNVGASDWLLPAQFTLLAGTPETSTVCRIAWRIGSQVGCQFIKQLAGNDRNGNWISPVEPERTEKVIKSRVLKRPLIIS